MKLGVIELLFIAQMLLLVSALFCYWIGKAAAKRNQDDWLYRLTSVFWWEFRHQPLFGGGATAPAPFYGSAQGSSEPIDKGDWEGMLIEDAAEPGGAPAKGAAKRAGAGKSAGAGAGRLPDASAPAGAPGDADDAEVAATLMVRVVPRSDADRITAVTGDMIRMEVAAEDEKGPANKAMADLLVEALGVQPYQIQLIRGHYQPQKVVRITGMEQAEVEGILMSQV